MCVVPAWKKGASRRTQPWGAARESSTREKRTRKEREREERGMGKMSVKAKPKQADSQKTQLVLADSAVQTLESRTEVEQCMATVLSFHMPPFGICRNCPQERMVQYFHAVSSRGFHAFRVKVRKSERVGANKVTDEAIRNRQ
ncbi:hypothetical protein CEXT_731251 [Caerostris extrusa]|uniref:Uncharacterized protein n=1 Tax=Caerostris extrusa TaxID=172846 RepID=A0AAV4VW74_CAEEX|nr:hypothetical protein CEXT_731251 [Caerostris extrusa]